MLLRNDTSLESYVVPYPTLKKNIPSAKRKVHEPTLDECQAVQVHDCIAVKASFGTPPKKSCTRQIKGNSCFWERIVETRPWSFLCQYRGRFQTAMLLFVSPFTRTTRLISNAPFASGKKEGGTQKWIQRHNMENASTAIICRCSIAMIL